MKIPLNQFIITTETISVSKEINIMPFGFYKLFFHKGITISNVEDSNIQLIVLGDLYDYNNPDLDNEKIIKSWFKASLQFEDVLKASYKYSGDFLVFYYQKNDKTMRVFTDTAAQYEFFYSVTNNKKIVASSSYRLIDYIVTLKKDISPEAKEFYNSRAFKNRKSFIGADTNYINLKRIRPNHYLDFNSCELTRYFPNTKIKKTTLKEASQKGARMLQGYMSAAAKRNGLLIPVTAGWDSRLLLAASKNHSKKAVYFVFSNEDNKKGYDSKTPQKLFEYLNLPFNIVDNELNNSLKEDDKDIADYEEYVLFPRRKIFINTQLFHKKYPEYVILNGNISEIVRLEFDEVYNLTPRKIAIIEKYPYFSYALERYTKWFEANNSIFSKYGYRFLDMLYWEENCANWVSKSKTERRLLGHKVYSPFNSRELLLLLYGLPKKYRRKQNPVVYKKMIEHLWPEVLQVPINPGRKKIAMRITQSLGIFPIFRNLKLWWNLFKGRNKW